MGSVLQTANVHFDGTGTIRMGKDGTELVISPDVNINGILIQTAASAAYDKANTGISMGKAIAASIVFG